MKVNYSHLTQIIAHLSGIDYIYFDIADKHYYFKYFIMLIVNFLMNNIRVILINFLLSRIIILLLIPILLTHSHPIILLHTTGLLPHHFPLNHTLNVYIIKFILVKFIVILLINFLIPTLLLYFLEYLFYFT